MFEDKLNKKLIERKENSSFRSLSIQPKKVDFCSNDYLGFAKKEWLSGQKMGSTGSRLISGNSPIHEQVEQEIAHFHQGESALLFNSGYDANLGFFSCIPQKEDTVIYDQLCHASIRDGIRLGLAKNYSFKHNDTKQVEEKIKLAKGNVFVVVESVYSMDGDFAPLEEIATVCEKYNAKLIVDEAHATGIFGTKGQGLCQSINTLARLYTFGKALGNHGAAIVCSKTVRDYLINFSRPFIYTTALPPHSVECIQKSYARLENCEERKQLFQNISFFKIHCQHKNLIESESAIQCVVIGGNTSTRKAAQLLQDKTFDVRPILHPTVAKGTERLRICLHSFNTEEEIFKLCQTINSIQ